MPWKSPKDKLDYQRMVRATPAGREYYRRAAKKYNASPKAKEAMARYEKTAKSSYRQYKHNAKTRGLDFALPFEWFKQLILLPCMYCGSSPAGGVDRFDNARGYTVVNALPCCSTCNRFKGSLDTDVFLKHCFMIAYFNTP